MATDTDVNRFGLGLLETDRASEAKPGEAMASRQTGIFAVMNETSKSMISYDYITRFMKAYQDFKSKLVASGNIGKIGKIDIGVEPAVALTNATIVSTTGLKISTVSELSFIRFYLDLDIIDNVSGVPLNCNPTVNLGFTVANNIDTNTARTYAITDTAKNINEAVYKPDYTNFEVVSASIDHNFTLDSIKVTLPNGVDASTVSITLNSLLVSYREVA